MPLLSRHQYLQYWIEYMITKKSLCSPAGYLLGVDTEHKWKKAANVYYVRQLALEFQGRVFGLHVEWSGGPVEKVAFVQNLKV